MAEIGALSDAARRDLDYLVARNAEAVVKALNAYAAPRPAYAACLYYGRDHEHLLEAAAVYVGLAGGRGSTFNSAWNPMEYDAELVLPDLRDERFAAAEGRLLDELERHGCEDRARLVLDHVAREVGGASLSLPRTDDFLVFVLDVDFGDQLIASLRFAAPPGVAEKLEAQGLLPGSADELFDWDSIR